MQLSLFTDYGLRTLVRLASQPERVFTTAEIASEFTVSRHHLLKIVQTLASAGVISTSRGVGGGLQLTRPAAEIRIGDIVRLLEGEGELVECEGKSGPCLLLPHCALKGFLKQAQSAFYASLQTVTLADCLPA